jgi:uroporphyrinogen decarboxylase
MTQAMTATERVRAAVQGQHVDRVPFCFWHHFKPEGSGERLAAYTLEFFRQKFDLDIVKIMPDLPYPPYPPPATPVTEAAHLLTLPRLSIDTPMFRAQLACIHTLRAELGNDYPLLLTLFSPLTYVMRFMGRDRAVAAIRKSPEIVEQVLGTITANLHDLMGAAIEAGASGIFFSCMGATSAHFTHDEYLRFGRFSDLAALEGARDGWLNTVHVHADPEQTDDQIYFELFSDYPVSVISWSDRLTGPTLSEALTLTDKCLMGGLDERGPLTHGSEEELRNEILSAVSQTKGHRLILANGCSIPDDTPEEWLHLARRLVDNLQ